jgi:L-aspartate oxidase
MKKLAIHHLSTETRDADVVVIGSGVAGLEAALGLHGKKVAVLSKGELGATGSSPWAQGGVAAAMGADDSPRLHAEDTVAAGAGLCDRAAVDVLTTEGPDRLRELAAGGANFDRGEDGELQLGQEAAHQRRRILHAQGDATGAEMVRALAERAREVATITAHEKVFALDLALEGGRVVGVLADHGHGRVVFHRAGAVVLATGGLGQLFAHTTNPPENTGDGLAMAARAGARLIDLEFIQFHPTALAVAEDPLPLVSEAVRGEGALLYNELGERFMPPVHPLAELAPRDVVARAIWSQQDAGRKVYLDATALGERWPVRFPTIFESCRRFGIDPRRDRMPVTPAAHYTMGGVAVDHNGRTSLPGLWACGEVSCTGVHGANRLASNSLLEGLVWGSRVAEDILAQPPQPPADGGKVVVTWENGTAGAGENLAGVRRQLRRLAWDELGLVRSGEGLERAAREIERLSRETPTTGELRNLITCARMVAAAASWREESRGSHFRSDFPQPDLTWQRRLVFTYSPDRHNALPLQPVLDHEFLDREIA